MDVGLHCCILASLSNSAPFRLCGTRSCGGAACLCANLYVSILTLQSCERGILERYCRRATQSKERRFLAHFGIQAKAGYVWLDRLRPTLTIFDSASLVLPFDSSHPPSYTLRLRTPPLADHPPHTGTANRQTQGDQKMLDSELKGSFTDQHVSAQLFFTCLINNPQMEGGRRSRLSQALRRLPLILPSSPNRGSCCKFGFQLIEMCTGDRRQGTDVRGQTSGDRHATGRKSKCKGRGGRGGWCWVRMQMCEVEQKDRNRDLKGAEEDVMERESDSEREGEGGERGENPARV
ncbi:unnamed protein product [Pleuronectes platessa]|uniref:Uncharacterized protein n=1 Tax=Pleuronectes platessa TaxID=8262 RepID=A0A9N7TIV5_PLEPL|nr:unnamed protein product [Pleuronectes platessa]